MGTGQSNRDDRILIKGGRVLSQDDDIGDLESADLLIEGEKIASVGRVIQPNGCRVIDASGMFVLPGFADGHRHTWQSVFRGAVVDRTVTQFFGTMIPAVVPHLTPNDVFIANLAGALDALDAGITTIVDWCHATLSPEHTGAAIDALEQSGIRAWFAHAPSLLTWADRAADHPREIGQLREERFPGNNGRIRLAMAARGPAFCELNPTNRDFARARELEIPISVHVSMLGYPPNDIVNLARLDLLSQDVALLHANGISSDEIGIAAEVGSRFVDSSPLDVLMGIGPALTMRLLKRGVRPGLSANTACANPTDLFWVMRAVLLLARQERYQGSWRRGERPDQECLTARDIVSLAMRSSAESVWLGDSIGRIAPGMNADIIILRDVMTNPLSEHNPYASIIMDATRKHVDTVIVAGRVVKAGGHLVGFDRQQIHEQLRITQERLSRT